MTVLTANVRDVAGVDDRTVFTFSVPVVRGDAGGDVVTVRKFHLSANDGVLETPDLHPGPAVLRIAGDPTEYHITVPDSATPVQLWPLIDAAAPPPSGALWGTGYIRDAGGVARVQALPVDDYPGAVKDPATLYVLFE